MNPLPAIVVSGFLGAGKTTLLNHLLTHGLAGRRVGVVVNDFGRLNVDGRLLQSGGHSIVELSGGCVCCTLQLGLDNALRTLAARDDLDALAIEASGITRLSALLQILQDEARREIVRLWSVVTLVDARRYLRIPKDLPVIRDQVTQANLLILSHCDEVTPETVAAVSERLRGDAPGIPIVAAEHGRVPLDVLEMGARPRRDAGRAAPQHSPWIAYEISLKPGSDPEAVRALTDALPPAVERVKGFLSRAGEPCLLQKVGASPAVLERCSGQAADGVLNRLAVLAREPVDDVLPRVFAGMGAVVTRGPALS